MSDRTPQEAEHFKEIKHLEFQGESLDIGAHEDGEKCVAYVHETKDGVLVNWAQQVIGSYEVIREFVSRFKISGTINGRVYEGYIRRRMGTVFRGKRVHNQNGINEQ